MEHKYLKQPIRRAGKVKVLVGDDYDQQNKYYAWLGHRAQCRFRKEEYNLDWSDWDALWTNDKFSLRGRNINSYCMIRIDPGDTWNRNNVLIVTRAEHLKGRYQRLTKDFK